MRERKLTDRQLVALGELKKYGFTGVRQSRLAQNGFSKSLFVALAAKGYAEWVESSIGTAWFITSDGRSALEASNA